MEHIRLVFINATRAYPGLVTWLKKNIRARMSQVTWLTSFWLGSSVIISLITPNWAKWVGSFWSPWNSDPKYLKKWLGSKWLGSFWSGRDDLSYSCDEKGNLGGENTQWSMTPESRRIVGRIRSSVSLFSSGGNRMCVAFKIGETLHYLKKVLSKTLMVDFI